MTHFLRHSLEIWDTFFYCNFNFKRQISQTCKICLYHLRDFRRIRRYLSPEAAKSVACALVTSHLDYCNSFLYNLPDRDIERLQRVQNCLARVVCKASRFSRSKPLLYFLHWLQVKYRIRFKLSTITFKAVLFHQPTHLFNYLVPLQNSRLLRSSTFSNKTGVKGFCSCISLHLEPDNLRTASTVTSFKKMLKTFLYDSPPSPANSSEIQRPVDDLTHSSLAVLTLDVCVVWPFL